MAMTWAPRAQKMLMDKQAAMQSSAYAGGDADRPVVLGDAKKNAAAAINAIASDDGGGAGSYDPYKGTVLGAAKKNAATAINAIKRQNSEDGDSIDTAPNEMIRARRRPR